jgi:tetratricopeptide (TPR) repeat protein
MRDMLTVLVPGLPLPTIRAILERADGIPHYAVETIRMLVEEGRLEEGDGSYRPVGDLGELHVPETLHALIAARLDAVDPADRALLQDGTILGQTFTVAALAALTGASAESLEPRLRALVQRELLVLDTDPRSPERGQYGFTQALVREVAHGTMSRKDRRDRHLAAARYFEALGDDEVAGVLATHYISAYEATPEGPEAEALGAQARIALRAAADRATSLGSHESAIAFWQRARTVTRDPAEDAELLEEIGGANRKAGHFEAAEQDLREASRRYREAGDLLASARATTVLCWVMSHTGRATEAHPIAIAAEAEVADRAPHAVLVKLWLALASLSIPAGERDSAAAWLERALADAEALGDPALVSQGMIDKGIFLAVLGRPIEGKALLEAGSAQAEALGDGIQSTIATLNISLAQMDADPRAALATSRKTLELAKRFGLVRPRLLALSNAIEASLGVGDWGWLQDELATIAIDELEPINRSAVLVGSLELAAVQGRDVASMESEIRAIMKTSEDTDLLGGVALAVALARNAEGRYEDASSEATIAERDPLNAPYALLLATRAAIRMGDGDRAMATLTRLDGLGIRGASSRAERDGLAAAISALDGRWPDAVAGFRDAWRRLRDLGLDVALGESQLDCIFVGPPDDPVVVEAAKEARETFGRTGALAYLRQLDEVEQRRGSPGTAVAADALSEVRG